MLDKCLAHKKTITWKHRKKLEEEKIMVDAYVNV